MKTVTVISDSVRIKAVSVNSVRTDTNTAQTLTQTLITDTGKRIDG